MDRKVHLVATAFQKYGRRSLVPGERFAASQQDVANLLEVGLARLETAAAFPDAQKVKVRTKRAYKRRDMRPED